VTRNCWFGAESDSLLHNGGDGTFTDVSAAAGISSVSERSFAASLADCDGDGLLDIAVATMHLEGDEAGGPTLWRNRGDGTFVDFSRAAGIDHRGSDMGCSWGDYDDDGDQDLFVVSQYREHHLYRNRGDCTFDDVTLDAGIDRPRFGYMSFFFDYDHDGDLDLFICNYTEPVGLLAYSIMNGEAKGAPFAPALYRNDGDGTFTDVTVEAGLDLSFGSMASNYADLDFDGYPEILLGNGGPPLTRIEGASLYFNQHGRFVEAARDAGLVALLKSHSLPVADIDLDGDLDVAISMGGAYQGDLLPNLLFENQGTSNHWLALWLEGTESNRDGIGAQITVRTPSGTQRHQVAGGVGFGTTQYPPLVIGLGTALRIDELVVEWPSGRVERFHDVHADRRMTVRESRGRLQVREIDRTPLPEKNGFYVSERSTGERPCCLSTSLCPGCCAGCGTLESEQSAALPRTDRRPIP